MTNVIFTTKVDFFSKIHSLPGIPRLHCPVRSPHHEELVLRVDCAHVVARGFCLVRAQEAALLQIQPEEQNDISKEREINFWGEIMPCDVGPVPDEVGVARLRVVCEVPSEVGYPEAVVAAELGVDLNVPAKEDMKWKEMDKMLYTLTCRIEERPSSSSPLREWRRRPPPSRSIFRT